MQKRKTFKIIFAIVIILLLIPYYFLENKNDLLEIYFIDVGQGDGILIKTPNDKAIIIDGGPFDDFSKKVSSKLPYRKRNIDLVIITHAHQDHYLGLINILENYKVNNIIYSGYDADFSDYVYLMNLIKSKNINLIIAQYGKIINLDQDMDLKILYPISQKTIEKDINNTSVVVKLNYKNFDAVFTGDLTCIGEAEILKQENNLESELLKIGHHGSKGSSCNPFLESIKPKLAIIQVGINNKFNHPSKEAISRINKFTNNVQRTDELGTILILSNGNEYWSKLIK
jgi:competence protein ComEC